MVSKQEFEEFVQQYAETALWSSTDDKDEPLDKNYSTRDISAATRRTMIAESRAFLREAAPLIDAAGGDYRQAGHDFWLTRNRHGAGFKDGHWGSVGDTLAKIARAYGEVYLHVYRKKIHQG